MAAATTTTVEDLPGDVLACALRRLDGPSLAAASCATASLRALADDPDTWRALCLSRWPSLAHHHLLSPRRLFADAFPFPLLDADDDQQRPLPTRLVSAVDVYHRSEAIASRVVETSTSSSWFLTSPFRVDAVEPKSPAPAPAPVSAAELELSWIVVDPATGRAVNVSSRRPVATERHWYTGETLVRFAVVLAGCKLEATVSLSEEYYPGYGHGQGQKLTEVSLAVDDADGAAVSGEGCLRLLAAAMAGPRKGGGENQEIEAKRRYDEFVRRKRGRKESKARREVLVDLCCSAVSAVAVLSFLATVVLR
uniref:F-box domain-containing protein n=1 Tax=Leersia perrieri TaxID=77586 RepID=A0A0D9VGP6_9ORYZ